MTEAITAPGTQSQRLARLGAGEKAGFAAGDFGFNLYWASIGSFIAMYYTDVAGLPAAAAGTMLLVTRLLDAAADPAMGYIADRTRSRWGRYRPYLLFAGPLLVLAGVLTFSVPEAGTATRLAYAYASFLFMMLAYSVLNIPYSSLSGVMTAQPQERITLVGWRFIAAFAATSLVNKYTLPLVQRFGDGDAAQGWSLTMLLYGVIALLTFLLAFGSTRERVSPAPSRNTFREDVRDLAANRAWIVLMVLALVSMLTITLRSGSAYYYMRYYIEQQDLLPDYLFTQGLALGAGAVLAPLLARVFDKTLLVKAVMMGAALLCAGSYFVPPENIGLVFFMNIAISVALGTKSPLMWSMYADSADYAEWRTGRRATGLVFAVAGFMQKAAGALAAALMLWLLAGVGYVANEAQPGASRAGIVVLQTLAPAVFALLSAAVMFLYPLNDASLRRIQTDLQAL